MSALANITSKTRVMGMGLAALVAAVALAATAAQAGATARPTDAGGPQVGQFQMHKWYAIPTYKNLQGYAIIDGCTGSCAGGNGGHAWGRVEFIGTDSTAYGKAKYAPFAEAALDGDYNSLPWHSGKGTWIDSWSDTFHLAYQGFKFRLCGKSNCGSELHIYF
jgi:hypothetical protein